MELGTINWHPLSEDDLAGYEGFREVASTVTVEDFPQIEVLEDGGIFALRLEGETPSQPAPLADVAEEAAAQITADRTTEALKGLIETLKPRLNDGTSFTSFGFTANEEVEMDRAAFVPGTPAEFLSEIFEMEVGELRTLDSPDGLIVVRLNAITEPATDDPEVTALNAPNTAPPTSRLPQDLFAAYAQALQGMYPTQINQQALNAVHANFQ